MKEFFESLYSLFESDTDHDFYTGLSGRFSYGEAPERCSKPYAVYFGLPASPGDTFTETINEVSFQINIYSDSMGGVWDLITPCLSMFDGVTISVDSHHDTKLNRELVTPPMKNKNMWFAAIEFSALLQTET